MCTFVINIYSPSACNKTILERPILFIPMCLKHSTYNFTNTHIIHHVLWGRLASRVRRHVRWTGEGASYLRPVRGTRMLEVGGSASGMSCCVACQWQLRGKLSLAAYPARPRRLPRLAAGA